MNPNLPSDWAEYRRLVLAELERLNADIKASQRRVAELEKFMIKVQVWAMVIAASVSIAFKVVPLVLK